MIRALLVLLTIMQLFVCRVCAQSYRHFTSDNGLPSTAISYLFQDSYGFVWIATENGLVRYDGARFATFVHNDNDSTSLAHDFVTSLAQDAHGRLFVSTYVGVQMYDYATNTFTPNVVWPDGSAFDENSNQVFCTSKGEVYSAGHSVCRVLVQENRLVANKLPMLPGVKNYSKVQEDISGQLWIAQNGNNLLLRLRNDAIEEQYDLSLPDASGSISDFVITPDGAIYVMLAGKGILGYNRNTNGFDLLDGRLAAAHELRLAARDEYLYLSSEKGFVATYNRRRNQVGENYSEFVQSIFPDCNVCQFMCDREGNSWLGIRQKGVLMLKADHSPFRTLDLRSRDLYHIGGSGISAIYEDQSGNIWFGTEGDGSYCLSSVTRSVVHHFRQPSTVTSFGEDAF
ncbi:MAG: two-component regulator propeller domain-containing protein, partial [Bacteroidales bacterium]|nr:two-component regulator propeller domain-containing protein [Bacteroidales bacterium]